MQEVFRTQDIGEIAIVKSLLQSANIEFFVFGEHLNSMLGGALEGSISACRFMVLEDDYTPAIDIIEDAGLFKDGGSRS